MQHIYVNTMTLLQIVRFQLDFKCFTVARRKGSKTRWPVYIKVSLYILYIVNITTSNLIINCWCNKLSTCTFKCFQILQEACPLLQTHQSPIFTAGGQSQAGSEDGSLRVSAGGLLIVHWSGQFYSDTPLIRSVPQWHTTDQVSSTVTHHWSGQFYSDSPLLRSVLQWHTTDQVSSTVTHHWSGQFYSDTPLIRSVLQWHTTDQVSSTATLHWSGQFYSDTPLIRSVLQWHTTDQVPQSDINEKSPSGLSFLYTGTRSRQCSLGENIPNFQWSPLPNAPLTSKILVIILNM